MRPSLKALRSRASDRAHRAAEGAGSPAGAEPPRPDTVGPPGAIERGTIRRRLRRARRMRENLLTELGALVMEMHRQRRHDPALVERKAREALTADREASGLARALGAEQGVHEVVAAGIAGSCPACGALIGVDDRFCARCGTPARAVRNGGASPPRPASTAPPPDPSARAEATPPPPTADTLVSAPPPPNPGARVTEPLPPPPAAGARAPAPPPPDPGARVAERPPPAAPRSAAPPPDPSTRAPGDDDTVKLATGPTRP
jgi:hypothetical protein